jgi:chorismate dehydratase
MKYPALRGVRIGCVKYLNSRPLICDYDGPVVFEHPAILADMLFRGELDIALVPVFEALRHPGYILVEGAHIAADGPVFSVFLAHRGPLQDIRKISLDPASLSSAHLIRILLAEFHDLHPEYGSEGDARLLIGNQAIEFRTDPANAEWQILDLAVEWKRCTGLPFVFAVWAMRPGTPTAIADELRQLKNNGLAHIPEIVETDPFATREIRHRYLTEHIRFDIGPAAKTTIQRYRTLLEKHTLIPASPQPLQFA